MRHQDATADPDIKQAHVGDFVLESEIVATAFYDDNIYASDSNEIDDAVFLLSPSLSLESDWKQHALTLDGGADLARYAGQAMKTMIIAGSTGQVATQLTSNCRR